MMPQWKLIKCDAWCELELHINNIHFRLLDIVSPEEYLKIHFKFDVLSIYRDKYTLHVARQAFCMNFNADFQRTVYSETD